MNCCSRSLALASRAAVSFRNWSICTTSLGPEQSLYPSALAWLPTHPPEETLSGRERQGHSWPQGPLAVTWVHTEHTQEHCPTQHHGTHKNASACSESYTHTPPTQAQTHNQTPLLPTERLTGVLSHTQSPPLSRNAHGHTLTVHIAQQTAPHAHVHVLVSHSFTGTQSEAQSYQHIQTHTLSETFSDSEKHTYSCTNLQELHGHTVHLTVM